MPLRLALLFLSATTAWGEISIANFSNGEELRYPAPLIRGISSDRSAATVKITNLSAPKRPPISGVAQSGHFVGLTHLAKGENKLRIECGDQTSTLTLSYKPQTNTHIVRSIYAVDNSGETKYQTPLENDPQNYREKFGTAMLLLQSLTAEWMHEAGFGRRTFNLELDADQNVVVHVLKDSKPKEHYFAMDDQKWWREMAGLAERSGFPTAKAKNIIVAGYTYFDPEKKKVFAHTALGGGGLGLFGSGGMFTWPNDLGDSFRAFSDSTPVDPAKVHNDSAGRSTHWGMAATTIGAVCHELGHTFGLPHTTDGRGIMARGFDHLNRMFTFRDAPSARRGRFLGSWKNAQPYWAPNSAAFLRYSRYFTLDDIDYSQDAPPKISAHATGDGRLRITADHGIRFVGISGAGDSIRDFDAFHEFPVQKEHVYNTADLKKRAKQDNFAIRIIDSRGNFRKLDSKNF